MKTIARRLWAAVNKPRVMHYLDIFLAGTATALYWDRDKLLGAHGLNVVGCLVFGAAVAGAKLAIEAYRKNFTPPTPPPAA